MWLNNACGLPRSSHSFKIRELARPSDRGLKAARELFRAVKDLIEPRLPMADGQVLKWANGQIITPGDERFRPLYDALLDAMPLLHEEAVSPLGRRSEHFAMLATRVHDCFVWATGNGSFSKDGPAARFVQAILEHAGYGRFELSAIERALRRDAPRRALAMRQLRR